MKHLATVLFVACASLASCGCARSDESLRAEVRDTIDELIELLKTEKYDEYFARDRHLSKLLEYPDANKQLLSKMKEAIAGEYGQTLLNDLYLARSRSPNIRVSEDGSMLAVFEDGEPELFMSFVKENGSSEWKISHLPR